MKEKGIKSLPDCLGCCAEPARRAVAFPAANEAPVRLYARREWWCSGCWTYREEFERFSLLYSHRLLRFAVRRVHHLPRDRRLVAAQDIAGETMEKLLAGAEKYEVPERVMFSIARNLARRRFPEDREPLPLPDEVETSGDPMDVVDDRVVLQEELAKLPEKTRRYLYEHKGLGYTADDVAARAGVSKGTVTVSVSRRLDRLRGALAVLRLVAEAVRHFIVFFSFSVTICTIIWR